MYTTHHHLLIYNNQNQNRVCMAKVHYFSLTEGSLVAHSLAFFSTQQNKPKQLHFGGYELLACIFEQWKTLNSSCYSVAHCYGISGYWGKDGANNAAFKSDFYLT